MKFRQVISQYGRPRNWKESVDSIRSQHGRGASHWLADRFGVSLRTAQKWLKGDQAPKAGARRDAVRQAGDRRAIAANALRTTDVIAAGHVGVISKSNGKKEGKRNIGVLSVSPKMRDRLDAAAEAMEQGDMDAAEQYMSDAILGGYGESRGGSFESAQGVLTIEDYPDGIG